MHRETLASIVAAYRVKESDIVGDADPIASIERVMTRTWREWLSLFAKESEMLAGIFIGRVSAHTTASLREQLKGKMPTVRFDPKRATNKLQQQLIRNNVELIKSIPEEYFDDIQKLVTKAVAKGRDVHGLINDIEQTYGVTKRRASLIARDQIEKATSQIAQREELALGIVYGRWVHGRGGKHPRPFHVKANGKIFKIAKGMYIQGRWVLPGMDINCCCFWEILVPGYQDFKIGTVPVGYKDVYAELQG